MKIKVHCLVPAFTLFLLSGFSCFYSYSQDKKSPFEKFYLQTGIGFAGKNGAGMDIGLQAIIKNKWSASVSYQKVEMDPKNLPADYESGFTLVIIFPFYDEYPAVNMDLVSFTAGRYFAMGKRTWTTLEGGLSFVSGETYSFSPQAVYHEQLYTSSNYSVSKEKKTTVGGMFKADFHWAFLSFASLGVGFYANVNSIQSPMGGNLKLCFGKMNARQKKTKH